MNIEIFSKDNCSYCDRAISAAQQFIQESEHTYEVKKLGVDFSREELFENFPEARTFPQIRIDGEAIGGYAEFLHFLEKSR